MNILDMDDFYLHEACYHASDRLMWDGRQQTEPAEMHRCALAAVCAEMYPDALIDFRRDKVLAAFDLSLSDDERTGILADMEANVGRFGSKIGTGTLEHLSAFLKSTAIRHTATDAYSALGSMKDGFPEPNFGAVMERCAEEVSGAGLGSAGRHAAKLMRKAAAPVTIPQRAIEVFQEFFFYQCAKEHPGMEYLQEDARPSASAIAWERTFAAEEGWLDAFDRLFSECERMFCTDSFDPDKVDKAVEILVDKLQASHGEPFIPDYGKSRQFSLKDAVKESRDASLALAGHDTPGDGTPDGR